MSLKQALDALRRDADLASGFVEWREMPERPARHAPFPLATDPRLIDALGRRGIDALYTHQAQALADPAGLLTVARGLRVSVVSAGKAPPNIDQMVRWPQVDPAFILACNEQGTGAPGLVKISLATGDSTTSPAGSSRATRSGSRPGVRSSSVRRPARPERCTS